MLKIIILFILSSLFYPLVSQAEITRISHIWEAKFSLENTNHETLVLWDVDRTLIMMKDQVLKAGKAGFLDKIKDYPQYVALSEKEKNNILSIVLLHTSHQLVEKEALEIVLAIQKRQIKTIAFSASITGSLGYIPSMEQSKLDTLKSLGFSFENAFPHHPEILFNSKQINSSPLFKDGLLCTSKDSKGEVLKLFLDQIEWVPKKIVMIDDQRFYLESVEAELIKLGIEFQGFHYTYVEDLLKNEPCDEILSTFQLQYLLQNDIWLTDQEAIDKLTDQASTCADHCNASPSQY